ncbi:hypothetical protein [Bradyrhizobium japonicum]|uniref:hypothetical protein n=1 Tax=Bradyrhizobium japonicum TaxID=375 RepID=UPI0027144D46|nr:hypothetical protein [Bradyrhizobium japonicum]WLB18944.1 hypothetical protein QIH95_44695 [Bradyrhizobium japonicum]
MKENSWHRRHAIQLASQLPEGNEDAMIILRLMARLVTDFLDAPEPTPKPAPVVVLIGGNECA